MTTATAETAAAVACLAQLLSTPASGEPPRRAVLVGPAGAVGDRSEHPGLPEVPVLSAMCEVVRRAAGLPVFSRDSGELMAACLDRNLPGAWRAMYSDVKTGDVDHRLAREALACPGAAQAAVAALLAPRDAAHILHVAGVLSDMLDGGVEPWVKDALARALAGNVQQFVATMARYGSYMRREVRDAVLTSLGRLLGRAGLDPEELADLLERILERREHDMAMLFLHASVADCVRLRPPLVRALLDRARAAPPAARYPLLGLLVRAAAAGPGALRGCEADVSDLVMTTLGSSVGGADMDARVALVSALLAQTVPQAPLAQVLAKALERTAAALISQAKAAASGADT